MEFLAQKQHGDYTEFFDGPKTWDKGLKNRLDQKLKKKGGLKGKRKKKKIDDSQKSINGNNMWPDLLSGAHSNGRLHEMKIRALFFQPKRTQVRTVPC